MAKRPLKVTGPKQYHLRGHQNHFPRANLEGASTSSTVKLRDKSEKTAWKLAAAADASLERYWLTQARQQLGVDADPSQVEQYARRLMQTQGDNNFGASDRAADAQNALLDSDAPAPFNGRAGSAGVVDPLATAVGGKTTNIAPTLVNFGTTFDQGGVIRRDGTVNSKLLSNADPAKLTAAEGTDHIAQLLAQRNLAAQKGDTEAVKKLDAEYQSFRFQDPAARARGEQSNGLADVGSQLSDLNAAPFGVPAAAIGNALSPVLNAGVGAWQAKPGERLKGAWQGVKDTAGGAAQNLAGVAALRYAGGPGLAGPPAATAAGRLGQAVRNLKPGNLARGGALVGGVNGLADLGRWAGLGGKGSEEDFDRAREAQLKSEVMSADGRGTGASLLHGAGAGARAMLTGNLDPARAVAGNAIGHWLPGTPAGRGVREAKLELGASRAGNEGYEQTKQMLLQDPRYKDLDPQQLDELASRGAEQASTGLMVDQQVAGNGQPNQASTAGLVRYTSALDRYNQGKPTAQDLQQLEQLAGGPAQNGKFSPQQLQLAGRNAMLGYRLGDAAGRGGQTAMLGQTVTDESGRGVVNGFLPQAAQPVQATQQIQTPEYQKPAYQQVIDHLLADKSNPDRQRQYQDVVGQLPDSEKQVAARYMADQVGNKQAPTLNPAMNWMNDHHMGGVASLISKLPGGQKSTGMRSDQEINDQIRQTMTDAGAQGGQAFKDQSEKDFQGDAQHPGGWMDYLKKNPGLGMIPLGLIGLMSGSKMGKIMGMMAVLGGAYNLYQRYQAIQDPKFQAAAQGRQAAIAAKTWTPDREQQYQQQFPQHADMAAAIHANLPGSDPVAIGRQKAIEMANKVLPGKPGAAPAAQPAAPAPAPDPIAAAASQEAPKTAPGAQQPPAPAVPPAAPKPPPVATAKPPPIQQAAPLAANKPVQPSNPTPPPTPSVPTPVADPLAIKPLIPPPIPGKVG